MFVALLAVSFITSSSLAQTACDVANETLYSNSACSAALEVVFAGAEAGANSSTNATAVATVCGSSTTCSQNIRAYIESCPFSELNYVDVLCANSSIHSNRYCVDILPDNDTLDYIFPSIAEVCIYPFLTGECNSDCSVALQDLRISYGCCFPELLQFLYNLGEISDTIYGLYLVSLPTLLCEIQNPFCNGVLPPGDPDTCSADFYSLYGANDQCAVVIRRTITGDISALGDYNTVSDDCRTRVQNFFSSCSEIFGDDPPTELLQLIEGGFALATATNNGRSCSEAVSAILTRDIQGQVCVHNYFTGTCSFECKDALMELVQQYGCCYNSFIAFSLVQGTYYVNLILLYCIASGINAMLSIEYIHSEEIDDQIEYAVLAREIFTLCGVQNPGFCTGIYVPFTAAGEACITAANQFYGQDDICTNNYRLLGELYSINSVQDGAGAICTSDICRSRLNNYADYLYTCQVGNFVSDDNDDDDDSNDDDDDDDDDDEDTTYITFANITRYTTCRGNDGSSCYAVIMLSDIISQINAAFDPYNASAVCYPIFNGTCTDKCRQLLMLGLNSTGCCIGEYGNIVFGSTEIGQIADLCQLPDIDRRCPEITMQQADRCTRAQNTLLDSASTCGDAFFAFQNAYFDYDDSTPIQGSLNQICQRDSCKSAVSEYLDACQDIGNSSNYDYGGLRINFDGFGCRQSNGNAKGDCLVLYSSDNTVINLGNSFGLGGDCNSAVASGQCSSNCKEIIQAATDSVGCCVGDIGDVFFKQFEEQTGIRATVDEIAGACGIPVTRDCAAQATINDNDGDGGGATEKKGLGVMILLLLGMMVTMLL